jgi:RNA polymerase sigma-70 factor (ECF subfamily)
MLGSSEDAIDATQTAFIQAYKAIGGFRCDANFRSWVCRIAINSSISLIRQAKRQNKLVENIELPKDGKSGNDRVWEAMLELPPDIRATLVLFYFEELSCEETAEALGCSLGAVRTRLHRARIAFKKRYEELAE